MFLRERFAAVDLFDLAFCNNLILSIRPKVMWSCKLLFLNKSEYFAVAMQKNCCRSIVVGISLKNKHFT